MSFTRRHLPHWVPEGKAVFVTWRLAGSVPRQARALDSGPMWLEDSRIAGVVRDALLYGERVRQLYELVGWVIMPNHVHAIFVPQVELSVIMRWLKGRTGRVANRILGRTGAAFWQEESFDHWVRSGEELRGLIEYVESNPVRAGLVGTKEEWGWSSAGAVMTDHE